MLVKVDRMSMAHGLEARVPFLSHKVVEFAAQIPDKYKLKWGRKKKYILKKIIEDTFGRFYKGSVIWQNI